jgi:hypothetical protein
MFIMLKLFPRKRPECVYVRFFPAAVGLTLTYVVFTWLLHRNVIWL